MLRSKCVSACTDDLLVNELDGQAPAQILSTAFTTAMLIQPALDINRHARIETVVRAAQDIDAV